MQSPRSLDHLVLPTRSLETARRRLTGLGFTVAPRGTHPFGTENCCVYFPGGTFLEPLAIADQAAADAAAARENVFVARDRTFRRAAGEEGLSALVLASGDADADHRAFAAEDISAGPMLAFSRPFVDAAGRSDEAAFRLAFAAPRGGEGAFFFACQRIAVPKVDRSALERHANGASAIRSVVAVADDVDGANRFLAKLVQAPAPSGAGVFALRNAMLEILDPAAFAERFGGAAPAGSGLRLAAVRFAVADRGRLREQLDGHEVPFTARGFQDVVAAAPGQGALFVFEEKS